MLPFGFSLCLGVGLADLSELRPLLPNEGYVDTKSARLSGLMVVEDDFAGLGGERDEVLESCWRWDDCRVVGELQV